jgi:serine/threonine-protein kinase
MTETAGERLASALADRYRVENEIGRGSSATVYLAHDLRHGRKVALKVLHSALGAALGVERFLREIRTAARLHHPHILPLFDSGSAAGLLYYTMPYVESGSLRDRLATSGPLPLPVVLQLATEVASALSYAHATGVVHRDIKPENILLSVTDDPLLTDFGIAHALEDAAPGEEDGGRLTETGITVGTPAYMSPEQSAGDEPVDERSDVYSLAAVVYECLTGDPPFTGPNARAIIAKRLTEPPPSPRARRPDLPASVNQAVERALARQSADRFASATDFAAALTAAEPSAPPRPVRLRRAGLAAGLLLALLLGGLAGRRVLSGRSGQVGAAGLPVVVVLPFKNLGPPGEQYFADGLTEEITARLAGLSGLRVISRTSADQYRNSGKSLKAIGADLGAGYVLEGSVRWAGAEADSEGGGRIRVTPQLIQVSDDSHLWADTYDAELNEGFRIQSEIAERVSTALDVTLRGSERATLAAGGTANSQAYHIYLRGSERLRKSNEREDIEAAIALYQRASALDSSFALALARLSQAHAAMYWYHHDHSDRRLRQAWETAAAAQRVAPDLPAVHIALGYYHYWGHLDYQAALQEFELARRQQPSNSELLAAIGYVERRRGHWDEAIARLTEALRYDPRSPLITLSLGDTYASVRLYPEAERYIERAIALDPGAPNPYAYSAALQVVRNGDLARARAILGQALARIDPARVAPTYMNSDRVSAVPLTYDSLFIPMIDGLSLKHFPADTLRYYMIKAESYRFRGEQPAERTYADSARTLMERRLAVRSDDAKTLAPLALMYAALGRFDDAVRAGKRAVELLPVSLDAHSGPMMHSYLARVYVMIGQPDRAIDELEPLLRIPCWISPGELRADPIWAPLLDHPRFRRLITPGPPDRALQSRASPSPVPQSRVEILVSPG